MLRPPSFFASPSIPQDDRETPYTNPFLSAESQIETENAEILKDQINNLTTELNQSKLANSTQVRQLNEQITRYLTDIQLLKKLQNDKEIAFSKEKIELEMAYTNTIDSIHENNEGSMAKITELEHIITQQTQEMQEMEQQIGLEKDENSRLKQSLGSIVSYPDREEKYKQTINELNTQINYDCKQIEFLNLRLEALQDILKLQEKNLSQNPNNNIGNLVTRWREKVFELLMRLKMNENETDSNTKCIELEFNEFKGKIIQLENETAVQKLCISEKSAQVDGLNENISIICGKNRELSVNISVLEDLQNLFKDSSQNTITQLTQFSRVIDNFYERKLGYITLLQHRVAFLTERVGFLSDFLRQNHSRLKPFREVSIQTSFPESCLGHGDTNNERILSLSHGTLVNEIQLLVRERSILQKKMKENSEFTKQELQLIKVDFSNEKEELQNALETMSKDKNHLSEENELFQNELEKFQQIYQESELKINELETTLVENDEQNKIQQKQLVQELQEKHTESLAELEIRLTEVFENYTELQDELTKTQDNAHKEKELAIESLKIENQDVRRKLEETRLHLQAVEAEKNILSLTIQTMTVKHPSNIPEPVAIPIENNPPQLLIECSSNPNQISTDKIIPPNNQDTFDIPIENPPSPDHAVPASELYSMLQELNQLSTKVFSL